MNYKSFLKITYGLFIISSKSNDKLNGYIANTVFQVTSEPLQLAVCCSKNNFTSEMIKKSKLFSVSVLEQDTEQSLIKTFGYTSGKDKNKFENINYIIGKTGVPIVTNNTIAWFECKINNMVDVGTHFIFIADVIDNDLLESDKKPLTYDYFRKVTKGATPKNAPTYINKTKLNLNNETMKKYECKVCGFVYEEENGDLSNEISPGTKFEDLPDNWVCPVCGVSKEEFEEV